MEIRCTNVNQALSSGLHWLKVAGVKENSRNGPVIVTPEPVMTVYDRPMERVLFSPMRDANPWFHVFESLHMLAGRNDLAWPAYFNSHFAEYSDDGKTVHGAYGYRWRKALGFDQLAVIAAELKRNPESRRAVLQMWDVVHCDDLYKAIEGGHDVPCNTHIYFDCRESRLNMTVLCRSNDLIWGAYGANAVHFSILQEFMAFWIGVPVGVYRQFSNNYHLYTNVVAEEDFTKLATDAESHDYYLTEGMKPYSLISTSIEEWQKDLQTFMENPSYAGWRYNNTFFDDVAYPMYSSWKMRKEGGTGIPAALAIVAPDWQRACLEWIERREAKKHATARP